MEVSIIIINYNTTELVQDCISSIYQKTQNVQFEIIVVDNASQDDVTVLSDNPQIRFIQSPINLGFGRANNLGAQYAQGEYLFFLNPDTILMNNAIYILHSYIVENPKTGICGGNLYNKSGDAIIPCHSYKRISPGFASEIYELMRTILPLRRIINDDFNRKNKPINVAYITGADLFIRKTLFDEIGGFDSAFFMYYEETYLCYQVTRRNLEITNVPQAKIIHLEGKSFKLKEAKEKLFFKSRGLYFNKRYAAWYYHLCNFVYGLTCMSRIFAYFLFNQKNKCSIWRYRLQLLFTNKKSI